MPRLVQTSVLPADPRVWLPPDVEIVAPGAGQLARQALLGAVLGADALITLLTDRVDETLMAAAPRLRVVANVAVGFDNIDVPAATRRGIVVANTPDVLTEATADFTFALVLAVARRVVEGDTLARSGTWTGWEPGQLLGGDVSGRTLGIVGLGRIGRAVARRALGFGMQILAVRRAGGPAQDGIRTVELPELLAASDFVTLHTPLNDATRGLIGRRELGLMKPGAYLINTARGACVDEDALADALESGHLAGAALDVYAREPEIPERLRRSPRTILSPHLASATRGTRSRMVELAARAAADVLAGRRPPNVVNPEVWR